MPCTFREVVLTVSSNTRASSVAFMSRSKDTKLGEVTSIVTFDTWNVSLASIETLLVSETASDSSLKYELLLPVAMLVICLIEFKSKFVTCRTTMVEFSVITVPSVSW